MSDSAIKSQLNYAAAGCSGSNKEPTIRNKGINEDRFVIEQSSILGDPGALFIGIFDGHGGAGASSFLVEHLYGYLEVSLNEMMENDGSSSLPEVGKALQSGFLAADRALFLAVKSIGEEYGHLRDTHCTCSFYREMPCRCLKAPRSAHEGSTATVLLFVNGRVVCANVGDSEAILVTSSGLVRSICDDEYDDVNHDDHGLFDSVNPPSNPISKSGSTENETEISSIRMNSIEIEKTSQTVIRKVGPNMSKSQSFASETMTISDTPIPDSRNQDYLRVRQIAETRIKKNNIRSRSSRSDGIRRGPSERFNYVALEGAHSLNMTRAFGNFGHKEFTNDDHVINVENSSPIIVRPHINIYEPASDGDFLFTVVGSDGLWDNIPKEEVVQLVKGYCVAQLKSLQNQDHPTVSKAQLANIANGAAELLLDRSLKRNQKLDDITLVVVLFEGVLDLLQ